MQSASDIGIASTFVQRIRACPLTPRVTFHGWYQPSCFVALFYAYLPYSIEDITMIGMQSSIGTVDAEYGSPDGRLMVRINDAWFMADELEWLSV